MPLDKDERPITGHDRVQPAAKDSKGENQPLRTCLLPCSISDELSPRPGYPVPVILPVGLNLGPSCHRLFSYQAFSRNVDVQINRTSSLHHDDIARERLCAARRGAKINCVRAVSCRRRLFGG